MTLQSSGAISISDISVELELASTVTSSLNDTALRALAGIASGAISLGSFYGKSNAKFGYIFGGGDSTYTPIFFATVDKYNSVTESKSSVSALPSARSDTGAVHSSTSGYVTGGYHSTQLLSQIVKMPFSTEVSAAIAATLDIVQYWHASLNNISTKGYSVCGALDSSPNPSSYCGALTYSTDTESAITAMPGGGGYLGSGVSSPTSGYTVGVSFSTGENSGYPYYWSLFYFRLTKKTVFSTETHSVLSTYGSACRAATSSSPTIGYLCGGLSADVSTTYDHISTLTFSTETVASVTQTTVVARGWTAGFGFGDRGYSAGGVTSSTGLFTKLILKFPYSTTVLASTGQSLTSSLGFSSATQSGTAP